MPGPDPCAPGAPAADAPVRLTLILPAYNEAVRIAGTLAEARAYLAGRGESFEIIVSADGTDGTREKALETAAGDARIRVIGGPERRGKGYGIRQAVRLARGEIIGFADADNKTPIAHYGKFEPYLREGCEVVIGSRGLPQSEIQKRQPWFRQYGGLAFRVVLHNLVGLRDILDTQCGFKFFQGAAARELFARQTIDGYMFDVEILYLARRLGYRIAQVPVAWRDDGDSRLDLVSGNLRNGLDLFKIRFGKRA